VGHTNSHATQHGQTQYRDQSKSTKQEGKQMDHFHKPNKQQDTKSDPAWFLHKDYKGHKDQRVERLNGDLNKLKEWFEQRKGLLSKASGYIDDYDKHVNAAQAYGNQARDGYHRSGIPGGKYTKSVFSPFRTQAKKDASRSRGEGVDKYENTILQL